MKSWLYKLWTMGYVFGWRDPNKRKTRLWIGITIGGPLKCVGIIHGKGVLWVGCYPAFVQLQWSKPEVPHA